MTYFALAIHYDGSLSFILNTSVYYCVHIPIVGKFNTNKHMVNIKQLTILTTSRLTLI